MIRNSVVLPQPDGPTSAPTSPLASVSARLSSTCSSPPAAARNDLCLIETSSRPGTPAGDMSFKRLHQDCFDHQHHGDEGESIGQDLGHVEQLERHADFKADAVGPPEQLDDENDLPDQR